MKDEPVYQDEDELRRLYHGENLSQSEISDRLGCSRKTVGNWMRRHDIEVDKSAKIRKALGSGKDHHTYRRETRKCDYCGSKVTRKPSRFTGEIVFCDENCQMEYVSGNSGWGPGEIFSDEELLDDLNHLASEHDRAPSFDLIREFGKYDPVTYRKRFGSLPEAREKAGLEKHILFGKRGIRKYPEKRHPYGESWRENRRHRLELDHYACAACGISDDEHREQFGVGVTVHHVIPARKFDDLEEADSVNNLVTMCSSCHRRWEGLPVTPEAV